MFPSQSKALGTGKSTCAVPTTVARSGTENGEIMASQRNYSSVGTGCCTNDCGTEQRNGKRGNNDQLEKSQCSCAFLIIVESVPLRSEGTRKSTGTFDFDCGTERSGSGNGEIMTSQRNYSVPVVFPSCRKRSAPLRRNWELYQRLWHGVEHEWPISVRLPFKFILEYSAFFAVEVPFKNLMIIRNKLKV